MTEQEYARLIDEVAQLGMHVTDVRTGIYDISHELSKGNAPENIQAAAVQLKVTKKMLKALVREVARPYVRAKYGGRP